MIGLSWYPGPEVIKLFSCSTQQSIKFNVLINVKMPTIVGILTFISIINTTSERLKARNFIICQHFSFYKQLKFQAQLNWAWKKFYNLGAQTYLSLCWVMVHFVGFVIMCLIKGLFITICQINLRPVLVWGFRERHKFACHYKFAFIFIHYSFL